MKFIRFKKEAGDWNVYNHKREYLGWCEYMDEWKKHKQWAFITADGRDFNIFLTAGCMREIAEGLEKLNQRGKE